MSFGVARPAVCADDRWYPSQAGELRRTVEDYIGRAAQLVLPGPVCGLIAPHAGYFFSGHVAGAGYRQVQGGNFDTVVLIGPDHTGAARNGLAIPDYPAWNTPLGTVPVDGELVEGLAKKIPILRIPQDSEHSLEVQLPFLQVALQEFTLLPVMMGSQDLSNCQALGQAVAELVETRKALLVASTDLSHFLPDEATREIDRKTLSFVLDYDPEGLVRSLTRSEASACGGGPVAAVMIGARQLGATRAKMVTYATSGDVWEDKSRVVGYAAVVLTR